MPFIETTPTPAHVVVPFLIRNGIHGESYGVELAADWQPFDWWRVSGVYAYLQLNLTRVEDAVSSHILIISASEKAWLPAMLSGLGEASVLTVSDMEHFTERGGMISLRLVGQKVRFDINLDATERAGLKLSSQLLRLARAIYGNGPLRE